ncbi:tartronate semialdehyde reductase [Bifidobacterium actinocoloniiforme DSM 22766]|uniref:Tartronate semialdehyde reductase n=1 Tax=Bifidobacterium actinocoloniiforme DSM 22766 TaxID=1437605 RepID=A0A086YZF8_9BIFI|nr:2-hydroxy-3-oxopropionate reductase [Bifidobacterium actinocoloniiforme]AKV54993.1 tartronate semialdehyde reductase [Bifidobacterium actinocoloniiforme DSM 22766]KFI39658.1 tartronate semialdehyde reductase [Bifidobacterium actinocoloniiforme DSM 22766]
MKVGFVGLGIMGKPMAINVLKNGYEVVAYDRNEAGISAIVEAGGQAGANGKDVAERTDVVITMLPNSPNVESALFDEGGIAEGLSEGKAVIDMSSIAPLASRDFAKRLAEKGVDFMDAPVSGGEPKAVDGTIAVMVGGEQAVFDKYESLLKTMASTVTLVGGVGAGNITKLANQMIVAINIAGISEAYCLAKKAGVSPENVYKAIRTGLAGSVVMDQKSQKIFDGDFNPGFRIELHIKDLQNVMDTAHSVNVSSPFSALAMEIMQSLKAHGHEKEDHSAVAEWYEMVNDIKLQED